MELLVHLNKRIKSRPKIQLPVETLLVQYQDPSAASFVTVRTQVYNVFFMKLEVLIYIHNTIKELSIFKMMIDYW